MLPIEAHMKGMDRMEIELYFQGRVHRPADGMGMKKNGKMKDEFPFSFLGSPILSLCLSPTYGNHIDHSKLCFLFTSLL